MTYSHHANLCLVPNIKTYQVPPPNGKLELYDQYFAKFGIDDARSLVTQAYSRPSNADILCLVVRADFITLEAQNALLKILEEPPESSKFVFVLPTDFSLLPTLASRFNKIDVTEVNKGQLTEEFREFITLDYKARLAAIDKAIKSKDLDWQRAIKTGLISHLEADGTKLKSYPELEFVARTLLTRGASNKMLLEHMSLLIGTR